MSGLRFLIHIALFFLLLICISSMAWAESPPNIVLIILDAARADRFSLNGYERETTPNIDGIAKKGVNFRSHFAHSTYTAMSTPQLLSSRYYSAHLFLSDSSSYPGTRAITIEDANLTFDKKQVLLYDLLRTHGYRSAIISENAMFLPESDLVKGFDNSSYCFIDETKQEDASCVVEETTRWIDDYKSNPFFLYVHIMLPHLPFRKVGWSNGFVSGKSPEYLASVQNSAFKNRTSPDLIKDKLGTLSDLYDSNLKLGDHVAGRIYQHLEKNHLVDDTIFVVTADHGENLGKYPALFHVNDPHQQYSRIPLVVSYPRGLKTSAHVQGMTGIVDVMPTILELAKIPVPKDKKLDGMSLLGCLESEELCRVVVPQVQGTRYFGFRSEKYAFYSRNREAYEIGADESINKLLPPFPADLRALKKEVREYLGQRKKHFFFAKRKTPLPFPFRLKAAEFSVLAPRGVQYHIVYKAAHLWPYFDLLTDQWRMVQGYPGSFLVYHSHENARDKRTVRMFGELPNGRYEVSVIVRSELSEEEVGKLFRYRFKLHQRFEFPLEVHRVGKPLTKAEEDSREFFSLLLKPAYRVKKREFSLALLPQDIRNRAIIVDSLLFKPLDTPASDKSANTAKPDENTVKQLETLGYL